MARKTTRNAQGQGSIHRKTVTKNGIKYDFWEGQITIGHNPNGTIKRKSVTAKTQKECQAKLDALKAEINLEGYKEPCKMTVEEWLNKWLQEYCIDVKYRTVQEYKNTIEKQIIPALGKRKLEKLTPVDVQTFLNGLKNLKNGKPLSAKRIKDIYTILHNALETAVDCDLIRKNPSAKTRIPSVKQKEIEPFNEENISAFLGAIEGHKYESVFKTALFTGLRESELCGLTWDCLDFKSGMLTVTQQLQKQNGEYVIASAKTDYDEPIAIAPTIMNLLREIRKEQLRKAKDNPETWSNPFNLVFTEATGRYIVPHVLYLNFKAIAQDIDLPNARFHDLRHSCATALLSAGCDIKTVQKTLRHKNPGTTQRYVHCTEQMMRDGADKMDAFIKKVDSAKAV